MIPPPTPSASPSITSHGEVAVCDDDGSIYVFFSFLNLLRDDGTWVLESPGKTLKSSPGFKKHPSRKVNQNQPLISSFAPLHLLLFRLFGSDNTQGSFHNMRKVPSFCTTTSVHFIKPCKFCLHPRTHVGGSTPGAFQISTGNIQVKNNFTHSVSQYEEIIYI